MTETPARKPRPRRTFSAFGDVRKMPSEYEIVTHKQNWTLRTGRAAAFEQNPSSPPNLWFLTYRDNSPLQADDWDGYRDPDALTYRAYVGLQSEAEAKVQGVLQAHADAGSDGALPAGSVALLAHLLTPSRYLCHGFQQVESYIGYMAPSSYITNAAAFSAADFLRRVTTIAYRTRELQIARPDSGIGSAERSLWEANPAWQPARKAVEYALVSYDWGEAFTALNLVLGPTLDDVLLTQLGEVAKANGDDLTWLLTSFLAADAQRRGRWSQRLAEFAVTQRAGNRDVLGKWVTRWSALADDAAHGLGQFLESLPEQGRSAAERRGARPGGPRGLPGRTARPGGGAGWRRGGGDGLTVEGARTAQTAQSEQWRETINLDELWEGDMTSVTVEGEAVLLINVGGQVRAYANTCPHQAGPLDEGDFDGETLICARHLWEFDADTGCGVNPDNARLTVFGCKVGDDGMIWVDIGR